MDAGPLTGDHTGVSVIAKVKGFIYSKVVSIKQCSDADLMRRVWEIYGSIERRQLVLLRAACLGAKATRD